MSEDELKRPIEWAARINRRWIVHYGLGQRADEWMTYLTETNPQRLKLACETARAMILKWDETSDPKPWFYSGLFSPADADEVRRFLAGHRLTTAAVPSMAEDAAVKDWEDGLAPETCRLLGRLREALKSIRQAKDGAG